MPLTHCCFVFRLLFVAAVVSRKGVRHDSVAAQRPTSICDCCVEDHGHWSHADQHRYPSSAVVLLCFCVDLLLLAIFLCRSLHYAFVGLCSCHLLPAQAGQRGCENLLSPLPLEDGRNRLAVFRLRLRRMFSFRVFACPCGLLFCCCFVCLCLLAVCTHMCLCLCCSGTVTWTAWQARQSTSNARRNTSRRSSAIKTHSTNTRAHT